MKYQSVLFRLLISGSSLRWVLGAVVCYLFIFVDGWNTGTTVSPHAKE